MYFESRNHESVPVNGPAEAVKLIHSRRINVQQAPVWKSSKGNHRIALVDDSHIDDAWVEVALVNLDTREQLESLTLAWRKTEAEKLQLLLESLESDFVFRKDITCPMDGGAQDSLANFTCGCCDERFPSTIQAQRRFDQDAGYGICPSCEQRYYPAAVAA
jgi:hypothetical protein